MKRGLIRNQHLYLKFAIFLFGIAGTLEVSLRQLALQSLLFILYLATEPKLYSLAFFAFRKLLPFFAAYWLLATLFKIEFMVSVLFSGKILHLVLITVAAWGAVDKSALLSQSKLFHKSKTGKQVLSFTLATYLFLQEYIKRYKELPKSDKLGQIVDKAIHAGKSVHDESESIEKEVQELLLQEVPAISGYWLANMTGLAFLCLLGLAHSC